MKEKGTTIHGVPVCPSKGKDGNEKAGFHTIPSCAAWVETKEAEKAEATAKKDADIHGVASCPILRFNRKIKKPRRRIED